MRHRASELLDRIEVRLSWWLLAAGVAGFLVSMPLWGFGLLSEWMMLGVTLVLSFAALWYAAIIAIQETRHANASLASQERFQTRVEVKIDALLCSHGHDDLMGDDWPSG